MRKGIIGLILDVNLELFAHVYFENEIETDLITDFTSSIATFIPKLPCKTSTLGVPWEYPGSTLGVTWEYPEPDQTGPRSGSSRDLQAGYLG